MKSLNNKTLYVLAFKKILKIIIENLLKLNQFKLVNANLIIKKLNRELAPKNV